LEKERFFHFANKIHVMALFTYVDNMSPRDCTVHVTSTNVRPNSADFLPSFSSVVKNVFQPLALADRHMQVLIDT